MAKKDPQSSNLNEVNGDANLADTAAPSTDDKPAEGASASTTPDKKPSKDVAATPSETAASAASAAPAAAAAPAAKRSVEDPKRGPFITEEMRVLFGFSQDEVDAQNEIESYQPPEGADVKFPVGRLLTFIVLVALCAVGYIFGSQALRDKEAADAQDRAEIEAAHRRQRPEPKMYGTLKISSSEPQEAYVLLEGKQIYTVIEIADPADPTGKQKRKAWTEMRAKRATTVQNLKITDAPIKFTLRAEGYDDYLMVLHMPAWKPLDNEALKGEFEKTIGYVELDPREQPPIYVAGPPDPKTLLPGQSPLAPPPFTFERERATRSDYVTGYYNKLPEPNPPPKPGSPEALALAATPPPPVKLIGKLTIDSAPGDAVIFINSDPLYLPKAVPDPMDPTKVKLSCDHAGKPEEQAKTNGQGQPPLSFDKYCYQRRIRRVVGATPPPGAPGAPGTPPNPLAPATNPLLAPTPNPLAPAPAPAPAPDAAATPPADGAAPADGEPKTELVIQWEVRDVSFYDPENSDGETYSVRLEWPNQKGKEPYLTNILPRQWQCTPAPADQFGARLASAPIKIVQPPPAPGEAPAKQVEDVFHMLCDYSFMVRFNHTDADAFRPPTDKEGEAPAEGSAP